MVDATVMRELAERVEALTGPDREVDCRVWAAFNGGGFDTFVAVVPNFHDWRAPYYTASIDAAMTLVPEGREWAIGLEDGGAFAHVHRPSEYAGMVEASTPALALTAAALRSLASQGGGE
jgi:hypothetical protein